MDAAKNIFDVDLSPALKTTQIDGAAFISREASESTKARLEDSLEAWAVQNKRVSLPLGAEIVKTLSFLGLGIVLISFLKSLGRVSLSQAVRNAPGVFFFGGICLLSWLAFSLWGRWRASSHRVSQAEAEALLGRLDASAEAELEIPADALEVDLLRQLYKMKNGKRRRADALIDYINIPVRAYPRGGCLCFAASCLEVSVPFSCLTGTRQVRKWAVIPGWNKKTPPTAPEYKPYKIRVKTGFLYLYAHTALCICTEKGARYEVLIPNYDADAVLSLIPPLPGKLS